MMSHRFSMEFYIISGRQIFILQEKSQTDFSWRIPLFPAFLKEWRKKNLIERQVSKKDRRYIEVVLTDKGASLKDDVLRTVEQFNDDVMTAFSPEEQDILKKSLEKLSTPSS